MDIHLILLSPILRVSPWFQTLRSSTWSITYLPNNGVISTATSSFIQHHSILCLFYSAYRRLFDSVDAFMSITPQLACSFAPVDPGYTSRHELESRPIYSLSPSLLCSRLMTIMNNQRPPPRRAHGSIDRKLQLQIRLRRYHLRTLLLFGPRVVSRPRASLRLLELRSVGSLWVSFRPSVSFAYGLAVPAAHAERLETNDRSRPQSRRSGRPFPAHTQKTISSFSSPTNPTSTSTYLAPNTSDALYQP
ncbi:hypothetical protein R3P38DRAFT_3183221 [Favolaschia claudopus]|uniref:Uncharacterized protein n=1 Tax=Favolaschia claudopus TaxID=2862362 RepID=A0AAW0CF92_9AGAR